MGTKPKTAKSNAKSVASVSTARAKCSCRHASERARRNSAYDDFDVYSTFSQFQPGTMQNKVSLL